MNADFHYYATFCAAILAGYSNQEAEHIAYSANFVDFCTRTMLKKCNAPLSGATTQSQIELADFNDDIISLQEITRIWSSFHFLPGDLYAPINYGFKNYRSKYRLICRPNGNLLKDTVELAKNGTLEAYGIVMHILADTWAHQYFAGTPSLVINNTNNDFYEKIDGQKYKIFFKHNPANADDIENRKFVNSIYEPKEKSIMNLGHGRAGHLPDLSFITYEYMPVWGNYEVIVKDNPSDYYKAFTQMVYALKFLRGDYKDFELNKYEDLSSYKDKINKILKKRQLDASKEWKEFAEELSKSKINSFNVDQYPNEFIKAEDKNSTNFANFIYHAMKQKSMVTNRIYKSGNKLAGFSLEYNGGSIKGVKDYWKLAKHELFGKKKWEK